MNKTIVKYNFNEIYIKKSYFEYKFHYDNIFEYRKVKRYIEKNELKHDKLLNFLIYYVLQKMIYKRKVI